MAATSSFLAVAVFLSVFMCASLMHLVAGKSYMSGDNHTEATEVRKQCCLRGWSCCESITSMSIILNNNVTNCIKENTTMTKLKCPLKKPDKKEARNEYCNILSNIDKEFVRDIIPVLIATNSCITYRQNKNLRTPSHFVETLIKWHKELREHHTTDKCCFTPYNITKTQEIQLITKNTVNRDNNAASLSQAKRDQTELCNRKWNEILPKVARNIEAVSTLQRLGRKRRRCLRGCENIKTVRCIEYIL